MEEIERRSESPSTRTSSRLSNVSNSDLLGESESKESMPKKRSGNSKRKSRNSDKENGELNTVTNGDRHNSDEPNPEEDKSSMIETTPEIEQNGKEVIAEIAKPPEEPNAETCKPNEGNESVKITTSLNGDAHPDAEKSPETSPRSDETPANESANADTEESFFTADTESIPMDRTGSGDLNTPESKSESENGYENIQKGVEEAIQEDKTEAKKGFFANWTFGLSTEKKESETNGHTDDINTSDLYYSTIKGRMPLYRASPVQGESSREFFRRGVKTPTITRTLDDSFGVKSEPSRISRIESREKPHLRKFPAKRCLNADEADDKEESFLSSLKFTKRRKLEDEKTRTGFLRSFLWSPFRKRSEDGECGDKGPGKSSWFRSPFWFWKLPSKEQRN